MDYHSAFNIPVFPLLVTIAATTILLVLLALLLAISFLVSGSEVAFFSLTTKDLNVLKTKKQPAFRRIVYLMEQPKTLLASMIIVGTFLNLGIIITGNILLTDAFAGLALNFWPEFFIKLILLVFLVVLFAEILPKVWATHHKVWFAASASLLIEVFNSLLYRLSNRMVRLGDKIEKRVKARNPLVSKKNNIDDAIDLLPDHEATQEEKQILKGIYKFGDTTVKQIMRTRLDVSGIDIESSFSEVKKTVLELNYSRLPVYENNLDEIKGMLHTKDLLPHLDQPDSFDWRELMRTPKFVHERKLIMDLLQEFRTSRKHFAIVVDEFGGTSGIVTLEDIMEEVIGEIEDEFDDEQSGNVKIDDNNYIFEGRTMIHDVCRVMKLAPDTFEGVRGDSDSLAGLVLEIAGEFPQINEKVISGDFTFMPLEINKNRIDKVKVTVKPSFID
ncbi:MAG: gliding motility-associated protein GldE [Ferruginibacter sp.]|nr:gliding motility-associated protein GldE [Ferruginibacter sp.]